MSALAKLERKLVASDFALILLFVSLVHAFVVLNDGVYFDGWLIHSALKSGDGEQVRRSFYESGLPIYYYLHRIFHATGGVLGYRLWAFGAYLVTALSLNGILTRVGFFSRGERLLVVAVAMSYPGYFQNGAEIIVVPYGVLYASFFAATWLTVLRPTLSGAQAISARAASLALFAFSFWLKSLVVFYGGVLGLLVLVAARELPLVDAIKKTIASHLDYVALPVVFWVAATRLFPTSGAYQDYNAFHLGAAVPTLGLFFWAVLYEIPNLVLREALQSPLPFVVLGIALWAARARLGASFGEDRPRSSRWLLLGALALLGLAALPYAAVGRFPSVHGWNTRHALLASVPIGLLLVWVSRLGSSDGKRSFVPIAISCLAVAGFVAMTWSSYVGLIARWAKDRSVIAQLHGLERVDARTKSYSVFWVKDELPLGGENDYRFYEWTSMFKTAWGGESHIGFDERSMTPANIGAQKKFFTAQYNAGDIDLEGCAARLTIKPGPRASTGELGLALRYLAYRYALRGSLDPFLHDLTHVEIQPLAERNGTHCAVPRAANAPTPTDSTPAP